MIEVPRVLCDLGGGETRGTLLCVGGLHGNEPAGVVALQRVGAALRRDPRGLEGRLVGLAGNLRALALGRRYVSSDLNRIWWPRAIERARAHPAEPQDEDHAELRELDAEIERIRARTPANRLWFLDLHTTSGPGPAFATFEDTLPNRRFAARFPVPHVLGLEEEIVATLANHLSSEGVITVGFESGQHDEPGSIARAEAAVWVALEGCGVLARGSRPEVAAARRQLARDSAGLPRLVEVRYRHPVAEPGDFRMRPGLAGFDRVRAGQPLARVAGRELACEQDGLLLMPLYQDQGDDGFFIIRRVHPVWLSVSTALRRLRLERFLHLLPGIRRHPELPRGFIVDRRRARWLALEIFHLLGFKRLGPAEPCLVMCRRSHDF